MSQHQTVEIPIFLDPYFVLSDYSILLFSVSQKLRTSYI